MIQEPSTAGQSSGTLEGQVAEEAVFIIGAGHFGGRAARLINQERTYDPIYLVDKDAERLSGVDGIHLKKIATDGIHFLVKNFDRLGPANIIVPAVPFHLAYEWLVGYVSDAVRVRRIPVPETAKASLPHTWQGSEGSLLVSYADFLCPDDCPEPEFCTVTGERRDRPLHDLLAGLNLYGFKVYVIRSHQLSPGLGGFKAEELAKLAKEVSMQVPGKWVLGTACRCHGVLTAFQTDRVPISARD